MGSNRETNLQDDDAALEAYRQNFESAVTIGSADQFLSVQGAARVLARQGKFDEALVTLHRAKIDKISGFWRHSMLLALGDTLTAAGRSDEAMKALGDLLKDESVAAGHRREAEERIEHLKQK